MSKFPQCNNTKVPLIFISFPQETFGRAFLIRAVFKEASRYCLLWVIPDLSLKNKPFSLYHHICEGKANAQQMQVGLCKLLQTAAPLDLHFYPKHYNFISL